MDVVCPRVKSPPGPGQLALPHSCWETQIGDATPVLENLSLGYVTAPQKAVKVLVGKSPHVPGCCGWAVLSQVPVMLSHMWMGCPGLSDVLRSPQAD